MKLDSRALNARAFATEQLAALQAAIDVNDVVDPEIVVPTSARRDYAQDQLIAAFCLSRQLWREGFHPGAMIAMARALRSGHAVDGAERRRLKDIRARFKHLRFAFVLYARDHRCPALFNAVTTTMGHLQDGLRQDPPQTARSARLLEVLLTGPSLKLLQRTVDRLAPSGGADYDRFVASQMARLRTMLAQVEVTGSQYHAARKIVSRQVSFHDDFRVLFPGSGHVVMSRYLSAINGLMGQEHDRLVAAGVRGELDYERTPFRLPEDIRQRLSRLVALYD